MHHGQQTATDIQFSICGSAGDGTIAAGAILKQAMAKAGYKVIAFDLYPPEIRGFGKCIAHARITSEQVYAMKPKSDVLVSLDDSHAIPHVAEVCDYGSVIYEDIPKAAPAEGEHISGHLATAHLPYSVPFRELSERTTGSARSRNIAAVGYIAGLYGMPSEVFRETIAAKFKTKPASVTEINIAAFEAGFSTGAAAFRLDFNCLSLPPARDGKAELVMMSGNAAAVSGSLDAGIETFFGYPITPATSIMELLAVEMPKCGGRMLQTEDEISAIAAVIGAGFAGVRAATATSGPGLALMTEMLGLGAMAEVPAVVFVSQRGGPSTGMPTKTEQSDLNLAVFGVAGDGQRIVLAPSNVAGCYLCAGKAFELAEKYQSPVIVLLDLYLSNRYEAVELPRENPFEPHCNKEVPRRKMNVPYKRYEITSDYISPRAVPGDEGCQHVITGLEHNEAGRPDDQSHERMSHKRHRKLNGVFTNPDLPLCRRYGDEGKVSVGLLGWGSNIGECLDAMIEARRAGIRCAVMKVVMLSPFPADIVNAYLDDCQEVLVPELNYQGQFANLVSGILGRPLHRLNRVPGMPMQVGDILTEIKRLNE
ncbi:MAG: 2-oxoacid:acceptor oxidoreductase subunit alpha [Gammaproteobacteria bacterium]|nr:2-oxoacid:acceptor oxidoreductase subunit alpha [Gammaproteobacteria bacterium]